ncbi:MAG: hypothetical protein AAF573_12515 [Bacteroidota bacterium]
MQASQFRKLLDIFNFVKTLLRVVPLGLLKFVNKLLYPTHVSIIVLEDLYENYQSESITFLMKDKVMLEFVENQNHILSPSDLLNVRSLEIYQFQIDTLLSGYSQSILSHLAQHQNVPKE